jgi:hypothetical protein
MATEFSIQFFLFLKNASAIFLLKVNRGERSKGVCAEIYLCANSASPFLRGEKKMSISFILKFYPMVVYHLRVNRREVSKGVYAETFLCATSASSFLCGEKTLSITTVLSPLTIFSLMTEHM